jgi:tetratricopeptide (TPR) repeat protein
LNAEGIDRELEDFILEKTEGIPFFIEELIRSLKDLAIIEKKDNRFQLAKNIQHITIPSTIQDMIMARIDSLPVSAKELLQTGSVIQREFSYELIRRVIDRPEKELLQQFSVLKDSELLYERGIFPQSTYIFKHALTQDVAYDNLLNQKRKEMHECIANAMEELYAGRIEEHCEVISHHYEQSGDALKAVHYLLLAGEKSNKQHAVQAASGFFERAFELIKNSNLVLDVETTVRLHQGQAYAKLNIGDIHTAFNNQMKVFELSKLNKLAQHEKKSLLNLLYMTNMSSSRLEAEKMFNEGIQWAHKNKDKAFESIIISSKGFIEASLGEPYRGYQVLLDGERMAREAGQPAAISTALVLRSFTERWLGRPIKTIELTEGMIETMLKMHVMTNLPNIIITRSLALAETGQIGEGIKTIRMGIDICEKMGATFRLGALYNCLGYCYSEIHQYKRAMELNLKSHEIASNLWMKYPMDRRPYGEIMAQANVNLIENLYDLGKSDEAWNRLKSFTEESRSNDYDFRRHQWQSRMNYLTAQILLNKHELDQAENQIEKNLKKAREGNTKKREGCFLRLLGELHAMRNNNDRAIGYLREAIDILKEVRNYRQLWQVHSSLASVFSNLGRAGESKEQWGTASKVIHKTAGGISARELREAFLGSEPIKGILSKAES